MKMAGPLEEIAEQFFPSFFFLSCVLFFGFFFYAIFGRECLVPYAKGEKQ